MARGRTTSTKPQQQVHRGLFTADEAPAASAPADRLAPGPPAKRPTPRPFPTAAPLEKAGHLRMAAYLHAAFPGGNPRVLLRDRKGNATRWEPPHPWLQWWHTPNQGRRSQREGAEYRAMGMRAGVPDLSLVIRLPGLKAWTPTQESGAGRGRHMPVDVAQAAFVEVKREGGGSLSPGQAQFRDAVVPMGAWWAEVRTVDELDAQLHAWLDPYGLTWPRPRNVGLSS